MTPHHLDGTDASQGAHVCQGAHVGILGARHRVDTGKIATVKIQMPSQVNVVVAPGKGLEAASEYLLRAPETYRAPWLAMGSHPA